MLTTQTYTVQANDTLFSIADKFYNNGNLWHLIYDANHDAIGPDRNQIQVGMVLIIPSPSQ